MLDEIPKEQLALIGWGLLALKDADGGEEFYYAAGRLRGYREAVEALRSDEFGWPDKPELVDAYVRVGRSVVHAKDIEAQTDSERVQSGVQ